MRAVITADFHINEKRLEDIKNVMNQISNYAIQKKVEWVWVLGDIYDSRKPSPMELQVFNGWLKKLSASNIKILAITGNHDKNSNISGIHYLHTLKIPGVYIRNSPFVIDGYYLGHHALKESKCGALNFNLSNEISLSELLEKYPDKKAYFLGHIHMASKISSKPLVMHVGSPERMSLAERIEGKIFIYLNNDKLEVVPLKTRPMIQLDLNPQNLNIGKLPEGAIIKVVLTGKKSEIRAVDEKKLLKEIQQYKPQSVKFVYNPIRELSTRSKIINESAKPQDCFKEYARLKNLEEEVIKLGEDIINEPN